MHQHLEKSEEKLEAKALARLNVKPLKITDGGEAGRKKILERTITNEKGCWIWQGAINSRGYGNLAIYNQSTTAHRLSYHVFNGNADQLYVCHKCDVKICVNPDHLFLGTESDNLNDCYVKDRRGKLSRLEIADILDKINLGKSVKEISSEYNVTRHAIHYWRYKMKKSLTTETK